MAPATGGQAVSTAAHNSANNTMDWAQHVIANIDRFVHKESWSVPANIGNQPPAEVSKQRLAEQGAAYKVFLSVMFRKATLQQCANRAIYDHHHGSLAPCKALQEPHGRPFGTRTH